MTMDILATIAERKIREAMERGEFDDLTGKGRPLAMEEDLAGVPAELRMAYRILKNAGFLPPEVELRKEIATLRELVNSLEDDEARRKKQRELDFKLLKLSMMRKRPINLDEHPEYREKVIGKLGG
ncbi:MAG TPA: DnaJ family domain-containing protein [Geobacteraceae bacterium]|nr:DnaJ family domain-containing protein [Geobacteraceae bacterium]